MLQVTQCLRSILSLERLPGQLEIRIDVSRLQFDRFKERIARGFILAGRRQMTAIVAQDVTRARGSRHGAAMKLRRFTKQILAVQRDSQQAERRCVLRVRRHFDAKFLLGRPEIAALQIGHRRTKRGPFIGSPA